MVTTPVDYQCGNKVTLSTYFYNDAKLPAAVINLSEGDSQQQVLAYEAPSASGARYEGQNLNKQIIEFHANHIDLRNHAGDCHTA